MVGRLAIASEVGGVGLALGSLTAQEMPGLLGLQALPKLVQQHEGDLVVAADFAGQLKSRQALDRIDEQEDRQQQIAEAHLAVGQDRSGGDAELVAAAFANPPAPCRPDVMDQPLASGADRIAVGCRPPDPAEAPAALRPRSSARPRPRSACDTAETAESGRPWRSSQLHVPDMFYHVRNSPSSNLAALGYSTIMPRNTYERDK